MSREASPTGGNGRSIPAASASMASQWASYSGCRATDKSGPLATIGTGSPR
jgi:hypothetical protein